MLILASLPAYAADKKCSAEVAFERLSARAGSIEYFVSIRHDAPSERANVGWTHAIDYTGRDGASHTFRSKGGLASAKRSEVLRSRPPHAPNPPVAVITGHQITATTCSYKG